MESIENFLTWRWGPFIGPFLHDLSHLFVMDGSGSPPSLTPNTPFPTVTGTDL